MMRQMSQVWHVGASDVTGLACGASDVTGLACVNVVSASDVMSRNVKTASQCLSGYVVQV